MELPPFMQYLGFRMKRYSSKEGKAGGMTMGNKFINIGGHPVELPPFTQYLGFSIKRHNLKERKAGNHE